MTDSVRVLPAIGDPNVDTATPLQPAVLDAVSEALGIAFMVYDGNDRIVYAGRQLRQFFSVSSDCLEPGVRLRDLLATIYGNGSAASASEGSSAEEWIAGRIAAHWKERSDAQEQDGRGRWIKTSRRRMPSGFGISVFSDTTDLKRREDQWRADMERVQLTEEILDNLAWPVFVQDPGLALVAVNKAFCDLRGEGAELLLGQPIAALFEGDLPVRLAQACRHTLETGAPSTLSESLGRDDIFTIHNHRVGKPGRYLLVTSLLEASGRLATDASRRSPQAGQESAASCAGHRSSTTTRAIDAVDRRNQPAPADLQGWKVLVITPDPAYEGEAARLLSAMGAESCSVADSRQAEAFFEIARSAGVGIDLTLVDTQMDMHCLELAEGSCARVLAVDHFQLGAELGPMLATRMKATGPAARQVEPVPDFDIAAGRPQPSPVPPPVVAPRAGPQGVQVLVAEDNEINKIVFSQILDGLGLTYRIAADGEEAVRLWLDTAPGVVIMDVGLPGLDGLEVTRCIREFGGDSSTRTPVIGVLATLTGNSREECIAAGMDDVILKPISPEILLAALRRAAPAVAEASTGR